MPSTSWCASAWDGLDAAQVWDSHAHLIGTGDSGSGIVVNPRMESLLHPGQYARRLFFLNAGCAHDAPGSVDRAYVERLRNLLDGMPAGAKLLLFAFDRALRRERRGGPRAQRSFYVPDAYARDVARKHPERLRVGGLDPSVPQGRARALARAKREGARAVKWLPSAMGIDPASPRCDAFYAIAEETRYAADLARRRSSARCSAARRTITAIRCGCGARSRRACAWWSRIAPRWAQDRDLDRGANGPYVDSFSLFARMFEKYQNCYGDISAMTQVNRAGPALASVIETRDWHARLLNGSDYPLPGVMPIFSVDYLVSLKLLRGSGRSGAAARSGCTIRCCSTSC